MSLGLRPGQGVTNLEGLPEMTNCNQINLETQSGRGISKKSFRKAFNRALKDLQSNGNMACAGGQCAQGGCGFLPTSITINYGVDVQPNGVTYRVDMTGDGECRCS